MSEISSSHNELYKNLKQLASSAKHRRRSGQTIIEGIHLCSSYLERGGRPLLCLYTDMAAEQPEVASILQACKDRAIQQALLAERKFQAISSLDNAIGVAFVIDIPAPTPTAKLQTSALLLEDIQDPGNMGTILRTAAAASLTEIFISPASSSAWSPKALRAGMGAQFVLNIYENHQLADVIASATVPIVATSLAATETIYEKDLSTPTAWLFGNEGSGVSSQLMALDVKPVVIPQNHGVESLNVAASVAVCLFEQVRQQASHSSSAILPS